MRISGLMRSSLIDYPGQVSAVLFTPGCNFDCFYCHNRALLKDAGDLDKEEIMAFLKKRRGLLDAVVISGGEPTVQHGLVPFMREIKALGYLLKLDTNGANPDAVLDVLQDGCADYFAVDYKAPAKRYGEICGKGADAEKVLCTIRILKDSGKDFEVRTTVVPQLSEDDIRQMARELPVLSRFVLKPYNKPEVYKQEDRFLICARPYAPAEIEAMAKGIEDIQPGAVFMG